MGIAYRLKTIEPDNVIQLITKFVLCVSPKKNDRLYVKIVPISRTG